MQVLTSNRFKYIEDARQYALERPGTEVIRKDGQQFLVEDLDSTAWSPENTARLFASDGYKPARKIYLGVGEKQAEAAQFVFKKLASDKKFPAAEIIFDQSEDGSQSWDKRFTVKDDGSLEEAKFELSPDSGLMKSAESWGIEILRKAIAQNNENLLLPLSLPQIKAVLESDKLTPQEKQYAQDKLDSKPMQTVRKLLEKHLGPGAALASAGADSYQRLLDRLNDPHHQANLDDLHDLAKHPETFQASLAQDQNRLQDLANTLKLLPGFRRFPADLAAPDKDKTKLFDDVLRTLDQYKFKIRIQQGMQFNRTGVASHNTDIAYRIGNGAVVTLGFSGRDYNFAETGQPVHLGYQDHVGDARQRLALGYNSGFFDARLSLARDQKGDYKIERPQSQIVDQYIARKSDSITNWGKSWAKENPVWTGVIAAGVLGGVFAYSKLNPDQKIPLEFTSAATLYENEYLRVKGAATPMLSLQDGKPDLGLKEVGVGISGNKDQHFYDANLKHHFDNTTVRNTIEIGRIDNVNSEVNLRYGFDSNSFTLDGGYNYAQSQLITRLGYRRDVVWTPGFTSYGQTYIQTENGSGFQTAGVVVGANRLFGETESFAVGLNLGYDYNGGLSGGFNVSQEF
ncbi:MAG TPA: hypothetical protein V6D23_09570 [Candidatus Obscuribacterales bacterium]